LNVVAGAGSFGVSTGESSAGESTDTSQLNTPLLIVLPSYFSILIVVAVIVFLCYVKRKREKDSHFVEEL